MTAGAARTGLAGAIARRSGAIRVASLVALVAGIVLVGRALPLAELLERADGHIERLGPWGPVAYGATYTIAALVFVPGVPLTLAAGALFGIVGGTAIISFASITAAALAFLIARHVARGRIEAIVRRHPRTAAVDRAVAEGGWKVVALMRLSPVIPFSGGNYVLGLTSVGFVPYVLASWVAMLPGTFVYVYLGYAGRAGLRDGLDPLEWLALGVGLIASVAVTVVVARRARRVLREQSEDEGRSPAPATSLRGVLALAGLGLLTLACGAVATWQSERLAGLVGAERR